ncbi:hypothetical protein Pse7367_2820 [Thalassoporum mexicanum PCC 7367]|uniref:hypothetical protein n=1 Tax=Thalassoporum mexicanum TaxID=3457544 RepID=UPI00029FAF15|nr:hypothetical protein [Pseudanabaena sp. PCC 7367]AFY71073.1 hypothetical protein Pse7367_2820 [Pseudanabaena sp. PCC 7367]
MTDATDPNNPDEENVDSDEYLDDETSQARIRGEKSPSQETKTSVQDAILKDREQTRAKLASGLLWIFGGTVAFAYLVLLIFTIMVLITLSRGDQKEPEKYFSFAKDVITVLLTTQAGLTGTALGFYFGSQAAADKK